MTELDAYLHARRLDVDAALDRYLPHPPSCPAAVAEAMRYSVMAGGKRMRPLLVLAAADAVAWAARRAPPEGPPLAMPAACAVEMIHTYSLIHDDLPSMDDDTMRRGRPTLHVVCGEGMAILAGDGLQAEAFALLAREPETTEPEMSRRKLQVIGVIATAAGSKGMVGGQAIDLGAVRPAPGQAAAPLDAPGLEAMHSRKTGALIRASAVSGAIIAGADEAVVLAIDTFAAEIGLAFQIVDDILDVEGGSHVLGKTAGKDAAAGKPTYPALYGIDRSRELARACAQRAEDALGQVGLADSMLCRLAGWIVERKH